jgi:uncharacterized RDD family membrane protein YckC
MDQRPPGGSESQPDAPEPIEPPRPAEPAPMPWERPQAAPAEQPRSTIISAEPVLTDQPAAGGPEVAWSPPPPPTTVPGAEGLVFAGVGPRLVAWFIDGIVLAVPVLLLASALVAILDLDLRDDGALVGLLYAILLVVLESLYFIYFWTSARRATPGMRAFGLQIGTAPDGSTLTVQQAVIRILALAYPIGILAYVPGLSGLASLLFLWYIVLLVSTAISPTKQGIHDRVARSAIVQPADRPSNTVAMACLVIVVGLVVISLVSIVALIFLGGQIEGILEEVGRSI